MKNTDLFLFFSSGKTFKMESSGFVCYFWQKKKKKKKKTGIQNQKSKYTLGKEFQKFV